MRSAFAPDRSSLRREWFVLALLVLALVGWLSHNQSLRRMDYLVQDASLRLHTLPANPDIALITIDDRSLQAIGRWPWRRALHAELVRRISAQQPRAIGLDILFGEEDHDYPADDLLLASALHASGRTVLPVARRGQGGNPDLPLPSLRQAAAALGHVQAQVDTDGVARGLHLYEGPPQAPWPHFSRAMLCVGGHATQANTTPTAASLHACLSPPDASFAAHTASPPEAGTPAWVTLQPQLLRFARPAPAAQAPKAPHTGPFTSWSYLDVLTGAIPDQALQGKYVLVGATATGLGDMFAAPVASGAERIPGVEMLAQSLNTALAQAAIRPAPAHWALALNLAPVALALLGISLLGPLAGLLACIGWFAAALFSALLAPLLGWQLPIAPALLGVALVYPLWSWRRLSAAAHFLQLEVQELHRAGLLSPLSQAPQGARLPIDMLEQRIHAVEDATRRLRHLHQFVSDSLQHLPAPTLVCDAQGRITLVNAAALRFLGCDQPPLGQPVQQVLHTLLHPVTGQPLLHTSPDQHHPLAHLQQAQEAQEAPNPQHPQLRHWLVQSKAFAMDARPVWLLTLMDLTDIRRAQAQRDQALHFISHDIRSPIASILTLLEMQRAFGDAAMPQATLLTRIERYAQTSLGMAQSFVGLANAQGERYERDPLDLRTLLEQAVDDAWASAQERGVSLHLLPPLPEHANIIGDRSLLARAVGNLLSNAIKFSPEGARVDCSLRAMHLPQSESALSTPPTHWELAIRDHGPGIPAEQQDQLFQPFKRLHTQTRPEVAGIGLGLALVHTVAQRHGGQVQVRSQEGQGAEFALQLPMPPPAPELDDSAR